MMVAQECGLRTGRFSHFVNNLHIYDRHLDLARELYKSADQPSGQPQLKLAHKGFWEVTIDDFELTNYSPILDGVKIEVAI